MRVYDLYWEKGVWCMIWQKTAEICIRGHRLDPLGEAGVNRVEAEPLASLVHAYGWWQLSTAYKHV